MVADARAEESIRPLRRSDYDRLVDLGAFDDEKLELLRGMIVRMNPQGTPHAGVIHKLSKLLVVAAGDRADVRVQLPFAATDDSEPEPDLAVVPVCDPFASHPTAALLIVEVAGSSLGKDRGLKAALYAEAAVPEYWIIDVVHGVVEVHRDPSQGHYAIMTSHKRGEVLRPASLPGAAIDVAAFLPPVP